MLSPTEKINLFKNLFKGRPDIFAVRWEKADGSASGYTPVCLNEWKNGLCLKLSRGKCKDCQNAKYVPLSEKYLEQHLRGYRTYGIYPLLTDNTSYFIAADFDGKDWQKDAINFVRKCKSDDLPVYLERSRSGAGGHAWVFFETNYPAYKSRNIILNLLREAGIIDKFAKEDSFDRLFPNQDYHGGKGLGNLIALPLQGESRKYQNTVFLDTENKLKPFGDQWEILQKVVKTPSEKLDELYRKFNEETRKESESRSRLEIKLSAQIRINKRGIPKDLVNFLRENLNFANSDYIIKKRLGLSVFKLEKYFKLVRTNKNEVLIPRGFLAELAKFLNEHNIRFELVDGRSKLKPVKFESTLKLFNYQQIAVKEMLASENGILVAPPGSGKTMIGIDLIAKLKQPALILVHKK